MLLKHFLNSKTLQSSDLFLPIMLVFECAYYRRHAMITFDFSGARDTIYRLSLEGLSKLEKASWPAKDDKIISCSTKGQTEQNCRNFVKVLVSYRDQLLACGTYAFSPKCSWRPIESINQVNILIFACFERLRKLFWSEREA